MDKILIWMIAAYGMSTILVYGSIFNGVRDWIHAWGTINPIGKFLSGLISCMLCTSTWVGFFFSICLGGMSSRFGLNGLSSIFFDGMFTAGAVWGINGIVEFFEENRFTKP